jgi:PAS domain S-box-containing protein
MKKNLLLVDENREFSHSLAQLIEQEGYQVATGGDSATALELNEQRKPQIAVIDASLNGALQLLEVLLEANPRLAVIMLTGKISERRAIEALNLGAFGYTMKYSSPEEILAHIRRASQHQESLERAGFSRSLFRTIFERTSDGICVLEDAKEGVISELNLPFTRILGLPRKELEGRSLFELPPVDDPQGIGRVVRPLLERRSFALDDVKVRLPDGRLRDLELRTGPLLGDQRGPVQLLARDITENKRMREKIAHSEKLAMLGEFTTRVAHEVRNPLAGIKGALEIGIASCRERV